MAKGKKMTWGDLQRLNESIGECSICLDNFYPRDWVVVLQCHNRHIFHGECLKAYLINS